MSRRAWIALVLAASLTGCSDPPPPPAPAPEREDPSGAQDPEGSRASTQQDPPPQPVREPEPKLDPEPEPAAPNRSPVARVTPTTLQAKVGEPVELDASNSSDPDGEVVSYTWRVGNGTPMTSKVPTFHHTFREPGLQTILLTVEDDRGATAVYVVQAVVKE